MSKSKKKTKKIVIKTTQNSTSVSAYLNSLEPAEVRKDAKALAKVFKSVTGAAPKMWGASIVGYGRYSYYRANGDEGEMLVTGFSIRKSGPVLYVMPGYESYKGLMADLGKFKLGKSCLYIKKLEDVNQDVLAQLIKLGVDDMNKKYSVQI